MQQRRVTGVRADDHKFLVELACSATLIPAYNPELVARLVPSTGTEKKTLVFIVCGGFKISQQDLVEYSEIVRKDLGAGCKWDVMVDGDKLELNTTI
jgi:L-serine/L-threonine ammonia-lyase